MIEHGQSKPLHSRIGWSLPEEARMRDETSCTHYRPETQSLDEYLEEVFRHLEYFEYPALVEEFEPEPVAKAIASTTGLSYILRVSARAAAIGVWSLTMNYQILPAAREATKH